MQRYTIILDCPRNPSVFYHFSMSMESLLFKIKTFQCLGFHFQINPLSIYICSLDRDVSQPGSYRININTRQKQMSRSSVSYRVRRDSFAFFIDGIVSSSFLAYFVTISYIPNRLIGLCSLLIKTLSSGFLLSTISCNNLQVSFHKGHLRVLLPFPVMVATYGCLSPFLGKIGSLTCSVAASLPELLYYKGKGARHIPPSLFCLFVWQI